MKVLSLFSGGLDSILSTIWSKKMGFEVEGIYYKTPFLNEKTPIYFADLYQIDLDIVYLKKEYLNIVLNPKYGWGKGVNPCLDCHAYMIRKTAELLEKKNANFIVTGEVLGQRPMSQKKDGLKIIDKLTGCGEITVRPLSGKLLPDTTPEKMGWIKREDMFDINGRGRKNQMKMALEYEIHKYENAAGGCLLTDENYSKKVKDLIKHKELSLENIDQLKTGRHFRTINGIKIIIGKNKSENEKLIQTKKEGDLVLYLKEKKSPICILKKDYKEDDIKTAAQIAIRYSEMKDKGTNVFNIRNEKLGFYKTAKEEEIKELRI